MPGRSRIIRVTLPGAAQAKPPIEFDSEAVPQGHQMGFLPPTLQPRVTHTPCGFAVGSVFGLERLDIFRHLATPTNVKARGGGWSREASEPLRAHQDRLNLSFPAVQGMPF